MTIDNEERFEILLPNLSLLWLPEVLVISGAEISSDPKSIVLYGRRA